MKRNWKLILSAVILIGSNAYAENERINQMISPAFNAVNFEDPRAISEARFLYYYHEMDDKFVTEGGNAQLYALQLRYALTDKLTLIATKDGYVDFNPEANVAKNTGWADLEAGLKYTVAEDKDYIASAQFRYLIPTGDHDVLQGYGDGMFHPSASASYGITDELTLTAGTGLRIATSSNDSSFWDSDLQLDYRVDIGNKGMAIYPLLGASLVHVVDGGKRLPIEDEGQDLFNFGATGADGNNILTGIGGFRFRTCKMFDLGVSYQIPLDRSEGSRIIDYRWNFDLIAKF